MGRPSFSSDCIKSAVESEDGEPALNVCLITADDLGCLLNYHDVFMFTQDELMSVFMARGLAQDSVQALINRYDRQARLYGLICALLEFQTEKRQRKVIPISTEDFAGRIIGSAPLLGCGRYERREVDAAIRDLVTPFIKALGISGNRIQRNSLSYKNSWARLGKFETLVYRYFEHALKELKAQSTKEEFRVNLHDFD